MQKQLYGPKGAYARGDKAKIANLKERMESDAYGYEIDYQIEAGRIPNARSGWVTVDPGTGLLVRNQSAIRSHVQTNAIPDGSTSNAAANAGKALIKAAKSTNYRQIYP